MASLLKIDRAITNLNQDNPNLLSPMVPSESNQLNNGSLTFLNRATDKQLNRLYKHIILAYLVALKRFPYEYMKNSLEQLRRSI